MLDHLSPGEHLCHFYNNDQDRQSIALDFIKQGLSAGEYVVIFARVPNDGLFTSATQSTDAIIQDALYKGRLTIFSKTIDSQPDIDFDVDLFTDWVTRAMEVMVRCEEENPNVCMRVLVQMDCILPGTADTGPFETYRELVNQYFVANHCIVLCQFSRQYFSPQLLLEALISHPTLVINHETHKNFYYTPPAEKTDDDLVMARFDQWINNLLMTHQAEEELYLTHTWIEGASDMVFWLEEDGRIVYANSTACERLHYTRNELLIRNIYDIEPSISKEEWKKQWRELKDRKSVV
jgi:PAS domain-containing protein